MREQFWSKKESRNNFGQKQKSETILAKNENKCLNKKILSTLLMCVSLYIKELSLYNESTLYNESPSHKSIFRSAS